MGLGDKMENVVGKAKEGIGDATNNESLQAEGEAQQLKAKTKDKIDQTGDSVRDGVDKARDKARDAVD